MNVLSVNVASNVIIVVEYRVVVAIAIAAEGFENAATLRYQGR